MAKGYWTHSKAEKQIFAQTMDDIDRFCRENGIEHVENGGTYKFTIMNKKYVVSNIFVPKDLRLKGTTYFFAGQTRLKQIYEDLVAGKKLDSRGFRKDKGDIYDI